MLLYKSHHVRRIECFLTADFLLRSATDLRNSATMLVLLSVFMRAHVLITAVKLAQISPSVARHLLQ